MRYSLYIYIAVLGVIVADSVSAQGRGESSRGGFSLSSRSSSQEIPDSLLVGDSAALQSKRLTVYRLTPYIGDSYDAPMDTNHFNFGNSTLVEAKSVAVGYLGNLGSPTQTKIFSERKESRDFIFADAYDYYITTPENACFYDTKLPYTNIMFAQSGASIKREDQLKGVLTWNFGKKVNIGGEIDYIYSRGQYRSNGNSLLSYRLFGSYRSDKYELNAYLSNFNFVNYENGGLTNDNYILNPEQYNPGGRGTLDRKSFPVRYYDTWNRIRGKQYFLTHRYNLGFYKELEKTDEEGNPLEVYVPVSSIIHTIHYEDNSRRFISNIDIDSAYLAPAAGVTVYNPNQRKLENVFGLDAGLNDVASAWNLKNTFALSLREGFQDWVKFGLTAFARFEKRRFKLPAAIEGLTYDRIQGSGVNPKPATLDFPLAKIYDEFSTYLGGELSKRRGSLLTYNARGELCLVGNDLGEFRIDGELGTTFPLFGKEASIKANGYIRNVTPAIYQQYNHSRYYWWDPGIPENNTPKLKNTQQFHAGGEVYLASTQTTLSAGVESIQNYVYFDIDGYPRQHGSNLQVISARLKQDFKYKALGWENEAVYQLSSDKDIIPLPDFSVYSNIYVHFKLAKVLTVQFGADVHYHTQYYAPYYEPATQQFQLQNEKKIGNYPLLNGYVNFHLKQARFFVMGYNLGSLFIDQPEYFSLYHYPLNPMVLKMGISVVFNN
ncbi:MAG: putative porin [Tannerellaceae bacterium]|nr:putative porin [Tannerellaceae bacterium]